VQVFFRGQSGPIEVPDQPAASPGSAPITRAAVDHTDTQATDHAGATLFYSPADSFPPFSPTHDAPVTITTVDTQAATGSATLTNFGGGVQWFAHADALPSFAPVPSVVTDLQSPGVVRGDVGGSPGYGDIGRGLDIAPLALNASDYADHGWFIVPSAGNEYGDVHVASDGFTFDVAAGEFTADWFLV